MDNQRLTELSARLSCLPWLATSTRVAAFGLVVYELAGGDELRRFLDDGLAIVEGDILPLDIPEFREFCSQVEQASDEWIESMLGFPLPISRIGWLQRPQEGVFPPGVELYCLANFFATPAASDSPSEAKASAFALLGLAWILATHGRVNRGADLLGAGLGFSREVYESPHLLRKQFDDLKQAGWPLDILSLQTVTLAECLDRGGANSHAEEVLLAYLGTCREDLRHPSRLVQLWAGLEKDVGPLEVLNLARRLSRNLRRGGDRVAAVCVFESAVLGEVRAEGVPYSPEVVEVVARKWLSKLDGSVFEHVLVDFAHTLRVCGQPHDGSSLLEAWATILAGRPRPQPTFWLGRLFTRLVRWVCDPLVARVAAIQRLRLLWEELRAVAVQSPWLAWPSRELLANPSFWLGVAETRWHEHHRLGPVKDRAEWLEVYLNHLAGVEAVFDSCHALPFLALCDRQSRCRSATEALRAFIPQGLPDDMPSYINWIPLLKQAVEGSADWLFFAAQALINQPIQDRLLDADNHLDVEALLGAVRSATFKGGGWDEVLATEVFRLGLSNEDFGSPATLAEVRLVGSGAPASRRTLSVCDLASDLWMCGRREHACRLLLAFAGLSDADFSSADQLSAKYQGFASRVTTAAQRFAFTLADALLLWERLHFALALLSEHLKLDLRGRINAELVKRALLPALRADGADWALDHAYTLARVLGFDERLAEAIWLLEQVAEITSYQAEQLAQSILAVRRISERGAARALGDLGKLLLRAGRSRDAVHLLMGLIGMKEDDLLDQAFEARRDVLDKFTRRVGRELGAIVSLKLADALSVYNAGIMDYGAVWLLQSFAGLEDKSTDVTPELGGEKLRAFTAGLQPDNAALYVMKLAEAQGRCMQYGIAAGWLQAFLGVSEYTDLASLRETLQKFHDAVQGNTYLLFLDRLVCYSREFHAWKYGNIDSLDQFAARVLECDPLQFRWLDEGAFGQVSAWNTPELIRIWLRCYGRQDRKRTLDVCRRVLAYLRRNLHNPNLEGTRRQELVNQLRFLRWTIIQTTLYWLAEKVSGKGEDAEDGEDAEGGWQEALCWDAELGHRLLFERLSSQPAGQVSADKALSPRLGPQPASAVARGGKPLGPVAQVGCFGIQPVQFPAVQFPAGQAATQDGSLSALEGQLALGVELCHLTNAIKGCLLLRAGFDVRGRLVWSLLRAGEGDELTLLAHGCAGEHAQAAIQAAVHQHEAAIRDSWHAYGSWCADGEEALEEQWLRLYETLASDRPGKAAKGVVSARLAKFSGALRDEADWDYTQGCWMDFLEVLGKAWSTEGVGHLQRRFGEMQSSAPPEKGALLARWAEITTPSSAGNRREANDRLARELDEATECFIREVGKIWDLAAVACHLDEATDLYVQTDDVLHGVPIPFLLVARRRLFEQVRSVQSILSPLLIGWLRSLDGAVDSSPSSLLVVSWFAEDDPAASGAARLHAIQDDLAARQPRKCDLYSAGVDPPGAHAGLAAALSDRPFTVVTVCGHGLAPQEPEGPLGYQLRRTSPGIALYDGWWTGAKLINHRVGPQEPTPGCDLRRVEFLIQVSCSVGRVVQSGTDDAEGFCVELAASRCQSALAGLWPLHSAQAPVFATWVAEEYLKLRGDAVVGTRLSEGALRGRAVALARKRWQKEGRGQFRVGLNTAAAFQLFGQA